MQMAPFKPVALEPRQQRDWEDTLAACSWVGGGFVHIIYTMLNNTSNANVALFTEDIDAPAATDGFQLIFKPSMFFKFSLTERIFVVLHEVCHEMWNHCRVGYTFGKKGAITLGGKKLPWASEYANCMQDFVINDTLVQSKLGAMPKGCLHDTGIASQSDDWVTAYFRNWQDPPPRSGGSAKEEDDEGGSGSAGSGKPKPSKGRFDQHLDPHRSEGTKPSEAPERRQAEWDIAVKTAMEIQRSQGRLPASLELFFKKLLEPKVSWQDHVEGELVRIMGQGAYDWRKLDRRLIVRGIGAPGTTGKGARLLIVGGDSSGSIFCNPKLVERWLAEVGGMVEHINPEETHVVWCDAKVQRVDICTDPEDVKSCMFKGVPGGGGTSFVPVFEYIETLDVVPDAMIYLTDLYGTFPGKEPPYPVIWGSITDVMPPFGKVVRVPVTDEEG
jgi:predicted metal-dependent peptidase